MAVATLSSSSSGDSPSSSPSLVFPLTSVSLGLLPSFVSPQVMESIKQLPEVKSAIRQQERQPPSHRQDPQRSNQAALPESPESMLHRSIEIFERVQRGGKEHQGLLALLAEMHQRQGNFVKSLKTLDELAAYIPNHEPENQLRLDTDIKLARAKILWLRDEPDEALEICSSIVDDPRMSQLPVHFASALNGTSLSKLLMASDLDDAFTVRDPARRAVKFLEQKENSLPPGLVPMAWLNFGCAEAIYAELVSRINEVDAPLDHSMRAWSKALTALLSAQRRVTGKGNPPAQRDSDLVMINTLTARLNANMAWGTLEMGAKSGRTDIIKASEYAGKALKASEHVMVRYNKLDEEEKIEDIKAEGFPRILSIVALCYQESGKAVTAEGLLQTAMEDLWDSGPGDSLVAIGPQQVIEQREILLTYSRLLQAWEKREAEGKSLAKHVETLQEQQLQIMLTPKDEDETVFWKGKSSVFSSLWFWMPNEFREQH